MKIHLPAYEPMLKGNEHLKHGEIDIDLGEDVVEVVRCKNCVRERFCKFTQFLGENGYCSYGERK